MVNIQNAELLGKYLFCNLCDCREFSINNQIVTPAITSPGNGYSRKVEE
jgi:hypothetical protein